MGKFDNLCVCLASLLRCRNKNRINVFSTGAIPFFFFFF